LERRILTYLILLGGIILVPYRLFAQYSTKSDSLLLRDFEYVKHGNVWLSSDNASGLTQFSSRNINQADVYARYAKGGLVDYSDATRSLNVGANVESYFRLSSRTVVYGTMSYDNFSGKNMLGSAFINTSRLPFNIVEDSLTNPGKKHRDTYRLVGAVGSKVWRQLSLGAKIDFTAANYAKYKDLRHKNKMLDMTLTAGLSAPVTSFLTIGANYYYRRNIESVIFSMYGKNEKTYKSLIEYGAFIGLPEGFGNAGLTDKTTEMPFVNEYQGATVQLELRPTRSLSFYNSFRMTYRDGYYGRKSPYTITFTNHSSHCYTYEGQLSYKAASLSHIVDASVDVENLENRFNIYRSLTNEAGASYNNYYGDTKSADKVWINWHAGYTANLNVRGELPSWILNLSVSGIQRKQTAYLYPYFRRQNIKNVQTQLAVCRNQMIGKGVLSLSLQFAYLNGSGEPYEDGTFATPSDKQSDPDNVNAYLYREYQYLTASQYSVGGNVKYSFIMPATRMKTFVMLGVNHRKANETYDFSQGRDHTTLCCSIGCLF